MSDIATPAVTWTIDDGVAVVRLDDGKVNVLSHRTIELVHAAVDEAQAKACWLWPSSGDRASCRQASISPR